MDQAEDRRSNRGASPAAQPASDRDRPPRDHSPDRADDQPDHGWDSNEGDPLPDGWVQV